MRSPLCLRPDMASPLLFPVALLQGLWVRATTPRLPVARGRRGRFGAGPRPIRVVGVGDSIIAGVGVETQQLALVGHFARRLHEIEGRPTVWRLHGFNGATSAGIRERIARHVADADVYLVSVGVNDAVRGIDPAAFATNLRDLVKTLRGRSPHATVIFAGIPPLESFPSLPWPLGALLGERGLRLQAAARALSESNDFVCFSFPPRLAGDTFSRDGFHPAAAACDRWAEWLLDAWLSSRPPVAPGGTAAPRPATPPRPRRDPPQGSSPTRVP